MASEWYIAVDGKSEGPFGIDDLKAKLGVGLIGPDTLVYGPGASEWTPMNRVGDLAGLLGSAGVPAPPPPPASTKADEIDYMIYGQEMQFVEVELDPGESAVAEAGSMLYMTSQIKMDTIFGDGRKGPQKKGLLDNLVGGRQAVAHR